MAAVLQRRRALQILGLLCLWFPVSTAAGAVRHPPEGEPLEIRVSSPPSIPEKWERISRDDQFLCDGSRYHEELTKALRDRRAWCESSEGQAFLFDVAIVNAPEPGAGARIGDVVPHPSVVLDSDTRRIVKFLGMALGTVRELPPLPYQVKFCVFRVEVCPQ